MSSGLEEGVGGAFSFLLSVSLCSLGRCGFVRVCVWLREEEANFFFGDFFFRGTQPLVRLLFFFPFFPLFPRERCLLLKERDYSL